LKQIYLRCLDTNSFADLQQAYVVFGILEFKDKAGFMCKVLYFKNIESLDF